MHLKRFLLTIGLAILLSGSTIAFALFFGTRGTQKLSAHTVRDVVAETLEIRRAKMSESTQASLGDEDEINILLLGLDARKEDALPHCDAIHMLTLNLTDMSIQITSVPRGTYAYIPTENLDWETFDPAYFPPPPPQEETELLPEPAPLSEVVPLSGIEGLDENVPSTISEDMNEPVTEEKPPWNPRAAFISNQSYLANACSLVNLDYGIDQIEKVVGKQADYLMTVGFSQTMGILRTLDLPTVETLQFLRHRQGYALGDPQRSHNQGLFLKDLIQNHGNKFADPRTIPLTRVLYSFIQTDMSFATAHTLFQLYLKSGILEEPDRITLAMKPAYATVDYHFDPEKPDEHLVNFRENIAPRLSEKDFSDLTVSQMQEILITYIGDRLKSDAPISDLIDKQIWLQVEDDHVRERIHFDLITRHLSTIWNHDLAVDLLTSYIIEKETLGVQEYAEKGKALLAELLKSEPELSP